MHELPESEIEARVGRALGRLPARRAPASLESRVLAEIERRAALPWWRSSFARWPFAARAAFALICAALIVLTVLGAAPALTDLAAAGDWRAWPLLREAFALTVVQRALMGSIANLMSSGWVEGALVASAALYAALFGLAIAGYRTLYLDSAPADEDVS
ncbi:MAG TPA: hypothetical protein VME42_13170 [Steroidobacteraceae bacterium]|nr:hypothetical protein [Steroidobacteraceae bacterium]